jgi:hypothetical protein
MYKQRVLLVTSLVLALALTIRGQDAAPLKLVQKIPMPNVQDRLDHLGVDVPDKRLFIAAPGAGTSLWVAELDRFFVAAPAREKQEVQILMFEPQR